jgi:hypothetical protein
LKGQTNSGNHKLQIGHSITHLPPPFGNRAIATSENERSGNSLEKQGVGPSLRDFRAWVVLPEVRHLWKPAENDILSESPLAFMHSPS